MARAFYDRSSLDLAVDLLGLWLLRREVDGSLSGGPIVETEAYDGPQDQASHARFGRTSRNAVMFGPPGHAYVYLVYGMHYLLNVVSEGTGTPGAVLLRGIEVRRGGPSARARRGPLAAARDPEAALGAGPARLSQALAIDRTLDGTDLARPGPLWIGHPGPAALALARAAGLLVGPRIGMGRMEPEWALRPWRFGLPGSLGLSRPFPRGTSPQDFPLGLSDAAGDAHGRSLDDR
ncbi:MAG TPA: DNA-3-methyladenine glycosylase [Candidatus Limnocylindrales bacterium]|nr:DNA-3-methyladenine glycosylase [Candidatus Limnocylindrales bacterium]